MTLTLQTSASPSQESVSALVKKFGELPSSFLDFLNLHNGVTLPLNTLRGAQYPIVVRSFLSAIGIIDMAREVKGLSTSMMPIADDDSGNYICLGSTDHRIYFWDHETNEYICVSDDFSEFIDRLDSLDSPMAQLQPNQVIEAWVNPGFKPKF